MGEKLTRTMMPTQPHPELDALLAEVKQRTRTRAEDMSELMAVAFDVLADALRDGDGKHPAGSFLRESSDHHLMHAVAHVTRYIVNRDHTDLTHAVCRLLMHEIVLSKR